MTTTAAHAGFIADICEHPEDDSIRLIYADWLEDHGDPERAALVRWMLDNSEVQAKFCHQPESSNYLTCWSDHSLEGNPYRPRWKGEKKGSWACSMRVAMVGTDDVPDEPPFGIVEEFEVIFRRGFIAEIHAPLAVLEKHLPALARQHPIERVWATDCRVWGDEADGGVAWHKKGAFPLDADLDIGDELPPHIFDALKGRLQNNRRAKFYLTADAAHAALSEALLRLAKER